MSLRIPRFMALCVAFATVSLSAQQISLSSSNVIGGSPTYSGTDFTVGQFSALKVVDEQTGPISTENFQTYWLTNGSGGYFVIDLGAQYSISQIDLYNTHNAGWNDFGTNGFTIRGSNSISFVSANAGYGLTNSSVLLTSTLVLQPNQIPTAQGFNYSNGLNIDAGYRYLSFTVNSHFGNGGGVNEFKVYGTAIPEPSTTAALAGLAVLGLVGWQRRRRKAA